MEFLEPLRELIVKTGIFIWPLLLCSVVGLAIFLKKYSDMRGKKVISRVFLEGLYGFLNKGKMQEALDFCRQNDSSISRIAAVGIDLRNYTKERMSEELERVGHHEVFTLGKYVDILAVISTVSTLLGLLGTISGMIKIFGVISSQDVVDPPALAGGISEALYTTAIGLSIAIVTFLAYKYLSSRYEELVVLLEQESKEIAKLVLSKKSEAVGQ